MTIYELIQELVQYDASADVQIKARVSAFNRDCENCETTLDIPGDVYGMSVDSVDARNGRVVEIRCEEQGVSI